jgi:predicted secreted protein
MATDAVVGSGFKLSVSVGTSPVVVTEIGQLRTAKRSGSKTKMVTVTNTDSPHVVSGGLIYEETLPTIISPGDVDFSGVFGPDDASQVLLQELQDLGSLNVWTISLPNARGHWAFSSYVSDISMDVDYSKEVSFSGKLSISGPVIYTAGS